MWSQQLQQIRQLAVSNLSLQPCSKAMLLSLLQMEGPPLRWTTLPVMRPMVNDAIAVLLPTLPRLTELESGSFDPAALSSLAFLSHLPALHTLRLDLSGRAFYNAHLDAMLKRLTQPLLKLTTLLIRSSRLSTLHLHALLTLMPRLESLSLDCIGTFSTLTFLTPVATVLRSLKLVDCHRADFTSDKLFFLQELSQLTELRLIRSMTPRLDALSVLVLTPPSRLLPSLQTFKYTP